MRRAQLVEDTLSLARVDELCQGIQSFSVAPLRGVFLAQVQVGGGSLPEYARSLVREGAVTLLTVYDDLALAEYASLSRWNAVVASARAHRPVNSEAIRDYVCTVRQATSQAFGRPADCAGMAIAESGTGWAVSLPNRQQLRVAGDFTVELAASTM